MTKLFHFIGGWAEACADAYVQVHCRTKACMMTFPDPIDVNVHGEHSGQMFYTGPPAAAGRCTDKSRKAVQCRIRTIQ